MKIYFHSYHGGYLKTESEIVTKESPNRYYVERCLGGLPYIDKSKIDKARCSWFRNEMFSLTENPEKFIKQLISFFEDDIEKEKKKISENEKKIKDLKAQLSCNDSVHVDEVSENG